jgi:hypothetical protein
VLKNQQPKGCPSGCRLVGSREFPSLLPADVAELLLSILSRFQRVKIIINHHPGFEEVAEGPLGHVFALLPRQSSDACSADESVRQDVE